MPIDINREAVPEGDRGIQTNPTTRIMKTKTWSILLALLAMAGFTLTLSAQTDTTDPRPSDMQDGPGIDREELMELRSQLRVQQREYAQEKRQLRADMRDIITGLEEPSREEVRAAIEEWRGSDAVQERLADQRELAADIRQTREDIRDLLPERPDPADRPELSDDARAILDDLKSRRDAVRGLRDATRDDLADATDEEREAIIEQFKEDRRAIADEIKELRRDLREEVGSGVGVGGENRPDAG